MELQFSAISDQVSSIKETIFATNIDLYSLVAPSAYDTAWLAMIPDDSRKPLKPMFEDCLHWVLNNQNELGGWGECDGHVNPTIESLISTLACIIALKRWKVGVVMINKGLEYIKSSNAEKLLKEIKDHCPRRFAIVFPGMLEFSEELLSDHDDHLKIEIEESVVSDIFSQRQQILETEELVDKHHYPPLLSFLEALPSTYDVDEGDIVKHLCPNGSLFQSPSATARAFLATGNPKCLRYLQSLAQRCSDNGVPSTYPIDEELIKLCIINHVQRLGLAEHFKLEIEQVLEQVHKNYMIMNRESRIESYQYISISSIQLQLLKDCLAFRLLRIHGYQVFPWNVCWFLYDEEIRDLIENNFEYFSVVILNIYRATDLTFPREFELQDARTFSRKLLNDSSNSLGAGDHNPFYKLIEQEFNLAWMARLDHLEHRLWIEESENNALWRGKLSFQRLSSSYNDKLVHLAKQNYEFRQFIYKTELDQLQSWAKDWGLDDMGFGREKTTYCYFAAAAASPRLPYDSAIRMIVAKSAILITVADDFFDMKGCLNELNSLVDAIRRWDAKGLCGAGKIIFSALDNIVSEMATKYLEQEGSDITSCLRDIWHETFLAWLVESEWGSSDKIIPSMDEYLKVGMISIATHTMILPASCYLNPSLPISKLRPPQYETLTKLVMIICRLLNDIQSYEKEQDEGIPNSLLLYVRNNPELNIEEAISYVKEVLNVKREELLEQVLMDGFTDLPKECRHLHLSCLKVFQMFFNSSNRYDSDTELLDDIAKAIYIPPVVQSSKIKPAGLAEPRVTLPLESKITKRSPVMKFHGFGSWPSKNLIKSSFPVRQYSGPTSTLIGNWKTTMPPKFDMMVRLV